MEQASLVVQQKHNELSKRYTSDLQRRIQDIENRCVLIKNNKNIAQILSWMDYNKLSQFIDENFNFLSTKLRQLEILNETETRLCILVLLNLSRAQTAKTLPYALSGVGKLKDQASKKLGTTGKNLRNFLLNMAAE